MADKAKNGNPASRLFGLLTENEKIASELILTNGQIVKENEALTAELVSANRNLVIENENLVSELARTNQELIRQQGDKQERAAELVVANAELRYQQHEKQERASESLIASEELHHQRVESQDLAAELISVSKVLAIESEKGKRSSELVAANIKLAAQYTEMEKRASELVLANKERILLLAQLLQSQKLESLGTLAGGVAHDINNVLGAILGLATAHLEIQPADSSAYRAFDTISKAAIRGGKLAKSLLNFARQSPAEELEVDVNAILREEVRLLERTTLSKICLRLDLTPDLRPIRGDASALTHAFMNLCVNAVDAMPEDGTLTLRTRNVDDDWIEVGVEDTGTGMTKDVLEKALDPFFTTKSEGKGTGLGLSLVYSTVKAHRGQMDIQSEPDRGTSVHMRFPSCEPAALEKAPEVEVQDAPEPVGLTVLLVDDDELIQSSTQMLLELLGHTVTGVTCGEDALEKLESGYRPEVVILDINMPGLGGARTLARLRALEPMLPVLLSTGRVDQTAMNLLGAYPHVTLLPKPFTLSELRGYLEPFGRG